MEREFKLFDDVVICSDYTGKGDVRGYIINFSFSKMHGEFFYDVRDNAGNGFYVAGRFLTRYRQTAEVIIASAKEDYRQTHTEAEVKAYEPHYIIGSLSSSHDALLEKYEKLSEKYEALKNENLVLNPIS